MSRVDVVVPCYQYGRYLRQCVLSVLAQEGVDVRVLIIDDASSDDTEAVGRRLAADSARVEYRRHPVNRGHVATFNEGVLGWAQHEYSLLLSADDLLTPGALGRATTFMDAHPEVGMTYGRDVRVGPGDPIGPIDESTPISSSASQMLPPGIGVVPAGGAVVVSGEQFLSICSAFCDNPVPTPTVLVRTAVQHAIGGYRDDLPHTGDMELWMRFAAHGPIGFVDARQGYYRWHGQNMQTRYAGAGQLDDLRQRLAAWRAIMESCRHLIPAADALSLRAARCIADTALARAHQAFQDGDLPFCEQCLAYAVEVCPDIRTTTTYARMMWKRRLGRTTWSVLQPGYLLVRRLRRAGRPLAEASESS